MPYYRIYIGVKIYTLIEASTEAEAEAKAAALWYSTVDRRGPYAHVAPEILSIELVQTQEEPQPCPISADTSHSQLNATSSSATNKKLYPVTLGKSSGYSTLSKWNST